MRNGAFQKADWKPVKFREAREIVEQERGCCPLSLAAYAGAGGAWMLNGSRPPVDAAHALDSGSAARGLVRGLRQRSPAGMGLARRPAMGCSARGP
jgi:hypothetical protein